MLIVIIAIIGVLVVGGGTAVWFFTSGSQDSADGESGETPPGTYERQVDPVPASDFEYPYEADVDICEQLMLEPILSIVAIQSVEESTSSPFGDGAGAFTCRLLLDSEDRYEEHLVGSFMFSLRVYRTDAEAQADIAAYTEKNDDPGEALEGLGTEAYSMGNSDDTTSQAVILARTGNVTLYIDYTLRATKTQPLPPETMINVLADIANDMLANL